jgi:hypothetical protein
MGIVAHYHEDEYGMREILPIEFWRFWAVQMGAPDAEAAQELEASDPPWREVFRTYEKRQNLMAEAISRDKLIAAFGAYLPRYERVETGTFGRSVPAARHDGFGFNPYAGLFFDYDEKEIVRHIWFVPPVPNAAERTAFIDAFGALSRFGDFLFVDRLWPTLMRTDDRQGLMRYLSAVESSGGADGP